MDHILNTICAGISTGLSLYGFLMVLMGESEGEREPEDFIFLLILGVMFFYGFYMFLDGMWKIFLVYNNVNQ